MNARKAFITLGLLLALVMMLPSARASERDQATEINFSKSVQIPGRVLPAGSYWFVVSEANTSRNIVQIFNSDRSMLYATVSTINTESLTTTYKTAITFAEREPMQPQTILSWFYPGHTPGHQFVYSNIEQQELAQAKHYTITAKVQNKRQTAVIGD
jgi:Protein of unknown function (DUF2911)